jgi:hypothetical protein
VGPVHRQNFVAALRREAARAFLTKPNKAAKGRTFGELAASFIERHGVIADKPRSAPKIERRNGADSRRSRILDDDEIRVFVADNGGLPCQKWPLSG